jgi:hypothetical protein
MKKIPSTEQVRARIDVIVTDIEDHSRHLGWLPPEEGDYEAHAILARIEAKLKKLRSGDSDEAA